MYVCVQNVCVRVKYMYVSKMKVFVCVCVKYMYMSKMNVCECNIYVCEYNVCAGVKSVCDCV